MFRVTLTFVIRTALMQYQEPIMAKPIYTWEMFIIMSVVRINLSHQKRVSKID